MPTPYFPSLRARLAARGRRTVEKLRRLSLPQLTKCLEAFLAPQLLSAEDEGANSRERIFSLRVTFQSFLWQLLTPHTACREVVRQLQALFGLKDLADVDESTSAYCQARRRLPVERPQKALDHLAQKADQLVGSGGQLGGRTVRVVDGTTVQMADTPKNRKSYPQHPNQKPGCGFPLMKILAFFSLTSGAILKVAFGNFYQHELRLFRQLWDYFKKGDIILGDRNFGDYATLAQLPGRLVDVLARLNAKRKVDFRKAKRLGRNDGLFVWKKPATCPPYLTAEEWAAVPAEITVRIVRFHIALRGCRTRSVMLVTTLLDPKLYPLEQLAATYARRWALELCFRDLKSQMGMEQLRCKTPAMAEKEAFFYLVAHNLIRCVMAEASATYDADLRRLSFKGTVDGLRQFTQAMAQAKSQKRRRKLWQDLLRSIAQDLVPLRPGRREPRALKRWHKQFPLLNAPRNRFKDRLPYRKWLRLNKRSKSRGLI